MMQNRIKKSVITNVLLVSFFYNFGFLSFFFAVPLQIAARGRDKNRFLMISVLSSALILLFRSYLLGSTGGEGLIVLDIAILATVIVALYLVNFVLYGYGIFVRLGLVTAFIALISLVFIPLASTIEGILIPALNNVFQLMGDVYAAGMPELAELFQGENFYLLMKEFFVGSYLAIVFYFILLTVMVGNKIGARLNPNVPVAAKDCDWNLEERYVWFLFVPLTLILLDGVLAKQSISFLDGYLYNLVSNILAISVGVYSLKGASVIKVLIEKWHLPKGLIPLLVFMSFFLITIPGVNIVVFILFAGLGVSELWVNYRNIDKE